MAQEHEGICSRTSEALWDELTQGRLSLHLLRESYPVVGHRYKGKPIGKALEAQLNTISGLRSSAG
jgi:hypothetical protein